MSHSPRPGTPQRRRAPRDASAGRRLTGYAASTFSTMAGSLLRFVLDKDCAAPDDSITSLETFTNFGAAISFEASLDQAAFKQHRLALAPYGGPLPLPDHRDGRHRRRRLPGPNQYFEAGKHFRLQCAIRVRDFGANHDTTRRGVGSGPDGYNMSSKYAIGQR